MKRNAIYRSILGLWCFLYLLMVGAMMVWVLLFLWVQKPALWGLWAVGAGVSGVALMTQAVWRFFNQKPIKPAHALGAKGVFWAGVVICLLWFFGMTPSNERVWLDEMARTMSYDRQGNMVTVHHVRNFDWISESEYLPHWESRVYDLDKLQSLDVIHTTWGNPNIAHIMLSFGFSDGQRLVFSVETRKESHETFSSIDGFFRQYELILIASDEKDIIYTRTNIRKERVSVYPITYDTAKIRSLFETYLEAGQHLHDNPAWYNTLTSNCTTVIYDLVKQTDRLPMDYRILVSGRLPSYLYELGVIDEVHDLDKWQDIAHANPKTTHLDRHTPSATYSHAIRQGLPNQNP